MDRKEVQQFKREDYEEKIIIENPGSKADRGGNF